MTSDARFRPAHKPASSYLLSKLDLGWRTFATGLSFFIFGAAGLALGAIFFPMMSLTIRDRTRRARRSRETLAWTFRRFIGIMHGLGLLDYELRGFEKLKRKGLLVVANHPSLIDTVFLLGFAGNSTCVVDDGLYRNSFTAGPLQASGYIRNDAGMNVLTECIEALDAGTNVLIFPEGTRTPPNGVIRMRRGVANIAVRAERNVTPVTIQCFPRTLMKGQKWWQIPERPPHFSLEVGDDIAVQSFNRDDDSPAMAVRRLTAYLEHYFTTQSPAHAIR
ncbi:MAG: 1-acyl-sn-glycerol-3-phosphate acyltransferase [Phycisphaerae bacterium]|nr:1-acyl-sn-glycerol-3-phosphate acyltransferase [Gemmatimonadaceae bacterium]